MERKKLYKAKKNWVIGLATGLAIMALGTNIAHADDNTSNEPIVTTQQANAGTQLEYKKDYNRYKDIDAYSNTVANQVAEQYAESFGKAQLTTYSDNESYPANGQTKVTYFENIPSQKTDMKLSMDNDSLQYHLTYSGTNKNYQAASATSAALSAQSDNAIKEGVFTYHHYSKSSLNWTGHLTKKQYKKELRRVNTHDLTHYGNTIHSIYAKNENAFNETKKIVKSSGVAEINAPKVTYNEHNVLSFIQSPLVGHGYNDYSFDYTNALHGYTYENGKQLQLSDLITSNKLVNKYLRGIAHKYHMQYAVDKKTGLVMSANDFQKGYSSFYLTKNGIFVLMPLQSGMSNWQNAVAVHLPSEFINDKYLHLFPNENNDYVNKFVFENIDSREVIFGPKKIRIKKNKVENTYVNSLISKYLKGKYTASFNGQPSFHISGSLLKIFVAPALDSGQVNDNYTNSHLVGSVDVSGQNEDLENDALKDAAEQTYDFITENIGGKAEKALSFKNDNAQKQLVKTAMDHIEGFAGVAGNLIIQKGFNMDTFSKLGENMLTMLEDYINVIGIGFVADFAKVNFADIINNGYETFENSYKATSDFFNGMADQDKYRRKYVANDKRTKSNIKERASALKKTREKQIKSINEGFATIVSAVKTYFSDNNVAQKVVALVGVIVTAFVGILAKYIWEAWKLKKMSKIFGLHINGANKGINTKLYHKTVNTHADKNATLSSQTEKGNAINGGNAGPLGK